MTAAIGLNPRSKLPLPQRVLPLLAVGAAFLLTRFSPHRLRRILQRLSRGARLATYSQASAARTAVVSVSLRCAQDGCLQRSIATALLCRVRGIWPKWCTGVRIRPFAAHAWVEAEGRLVDEPATSEDYRVIMAVQAGR